MRFLHSKDTYIQTRYGKVIKRREDLRLSLGWPVTQVTRTTAYQNTQKLGRFARGMTQLLHDVTGIPRGTIVVMILLFAG
jgi:hypothetical protein